MNRSCPVFEKFCQFMSTKQQVDSRFKTDVVGSLYQEKEHVIDVVA